MTDRQATAESLDAWACPNCGTAYLLHADHDPMLEYPHHDDAPWWCGCDN
jgi:hypothetical protein